ncbi:MAG TPA: heavy metal-binding domain-containing protein [Acidimicrobiales bacterium]|nr:heavy metal-binding domain-containing protein [Acidimicrobiales bacterium]
MTSSSSDRPASSAPGFSSGLSVSDFAACLTMGLEPVGLVQGFCAMQSSNYAVGLQRNLSPFTAQGGYVENYQCPHGMVSGEHRMWGQNYEQRWIEQSWREGFSKALARMLDEATALGAHGVVGVLDSETTLVGAGVIEYHVRGTAVRVAGAPAPTTAPWTTYLAGQRLAKSFEAGFAPVSVVATIASVRVWAYCITEYLMGGGGLGGWSPGVGAVEIEQTVRAHGQVRELVRANARDELHGDELHGVQLRVVEHEYERGDLEIQALLRGNRLRRVGAFQALATPQPTVRLS